MCRIYMCGEGGGSTGAADRTKKPEKPTTSTTKKDKQKNWFVLLYLRASSAF